LLAGKLAVKQLQNQWNSYTRPQVVKLLLEQLELTRNDEFPEWAEDKAEEVFEAVRLRAAFDQNFLKAKTWAIYREHIDKKAARLLRKLEWRFAMCFDAFQEWRDLTLLAIEITGWSYTAEQLIDYWVSNGGQVDPGWHSERTGANA
jgi:hypothetical protein